MTYSNQEISDYYDQTEIHYKRAWDLGESLAMHYGYWEEDTKNFRESLRGMNTALSSFGEITANHKVLDAGCGVGGSSVFLAKEIGCRVDGITLSQKQVESATKNAAEKGVSELTAFSLNDFTATDFPDNSFDIIWTLEAVVHANDKSDFLKEAYRLLKPGGRVVMGEYFKTEKQLNSKEKKTLQKWLNAWAIEDICSVAEFTSKAQDAGFAEVKFKNVTPNIRKSAWRMFYGSFFMTTLSALYRLYNPKVSRFADNHYKALYYQYPALRKGLWSYEFVRLVKE